MKKYNNILSTFLLLGIFLTLLSSYNSKEERKSTPIGTVIYSILPPEYFLAEHQGWVLLDGRKLDESKLSKLLLTYSEQKFDSLPNALGVFLRSSNYNGKGLDIDSGRKLGELQKDATKRSNKVMTGTGIANDSLSFHAHLVKNAKASRISRIGKYTSGGRYYPMTEDQTIYDGRHIHNVKINIDGGGDLETRPKNISLYTYIKIN